MKQLRFTTTKPMGMIGIFNPEEDHQPLVIPTEVGELIMDKTKGSGAYIHGEAERKAGFDIPTFIDGNLAQLERPVEEQDILMLLPDGEYKCKAEYCDQFGASNCYLITLVTEPLAVKEEDNEPNFFYYIKKGHFAICDLAFCEESDRTFDLPLFDLANNAKLLNELGLFYIYGSYGIRYNYHSRGKWFCGYLAAFHPEDKGQYGKSCTNPTIRLLIEDHALLQQVKPLLHKKSTHV